jgi:hypothetical protein
MVLDRLDIPDGSLLDREWSREWGPFNTEAAAKVWVEQVGQFDVNGLCLPASIEARQSATWTVHDLRQP